MRFVSSSRRKSSLGRSLVCSLATAPTASGGPLATPRLRSVRPRCFVAFVASVRLCRFWLCLDCSHPRGALHGGLLHDLRDFLRSALWSRLAARRPKDFAGAESGVLRSPFLASALSSPCGPSLLSGGLWTRMRFFVWGGEPTSTCLACGLGPHTVEHALWSCPMHAVRLWQLRATISAAGFSELARGLPHSLEPCFWRCGLAPVWCDLPAALVETIQQYVLASAQSSTRVLAFRKGVG